MTENIRILLIVPPALGGMVLGSVPVLMDNTILDPMSLMVIIFDGTNIVNLMDIQ